MTSSTAAARHDDVRERTSSVDDTVASTLDGSIQLTGELGHRVDVAPGAHRVAPSDGYDVRLFTLACQFATEALGQGDATVRGVLAFGDQVDVGAHGAFDEEVAHEPWVPGVRHRSIGSKDEVRVQS